MVHCLIKHRDSIIFLLTAVDVCGRKRPWPVVRVLSLYLPPSQSSVQVRRLPSQRPPCRVRPPVLSLSATHLPRLLIIQVSIIWCPILIQATPGVLKCRRSIKNRSTIQSVTCKNSDVFRLYICSRHQTRYRTLNKKTVSYFFSLSTYLLLSSFQRLQSEFLPHI
jgi:hypothetical protein